MGSRVVHLKALAHRERVDMTQVYGPMPDQCVLELTGVILWCLKGGNIRVEQTKNEKKLLCCEGASSMWRLTRRTQGYRVPSELERVHKVARKKRKERFSALLQGRRSGLTTSPTRSYTSPS